MQPLIDTSSANQGSSDRNTGQLFMQQACKYSNDSWCSIDIVLLHNNIIRISCIPNVDGMMQLHHATNPIIFNSGPMSPHTGTIQDSHKVESADKWKCFFHIKYKQQRQITVVYQQAQQIPKRNCMPRLHGLQTILNKNTGQVQENTNRCYNLPRHFHHSQASYMTTIPIPTSCTKSTTTKSNVVQALQ